MIKSNVILTRKHIELAIEIKKTAVESDKTVGILTFEQYHGRRNIGSSKIRGHWLARNWPEAEIFRMGQKYDTVIYQKAYWPKHAKLFKGTKILDVCDPDFLHWGYQIKEMIEEVDAITTSTEALAETFRCFTNKPVLCIPDRVDLTTHKRRKFHMDQAKKVSWFGYSTGFDMLKSVLMHLKKHGLNLTVISDKEFAMSVSYFDYIELINIKWNDETAYDEILKTDFVINPQSTQGKWKYKSNNKTIIAWSLGMPVANNVEDLVRFLDPVERENEIQKRLQEVKDKWDIKYSVEEYKKLIDSILKSKHED